MDKRVVRTKAAIKKVFLSLRDKSRLEKIRVSDICELADINKTTFYKYYSDVFALNNEICNELIEAIWNGWPARSCLISDTSTFISGLPDAIDSQGEIVRILFHDRREDLFSRLEELLIEHYITEDMPQSAKIRVLFGIKGIIRMLYEVKLQGTFTIDELAGCVAPIFADMEAESK